VPDVELGLLGVLPEGQLVGGPMSGSGPRTGGVVTLALPGDRHDVVRAGGAVLRDDEWTPFARLLDVEAVANTDPTLVRGRLEAFGAREAGFRRATALTAADAGAHTAAHLVVLRRLPVGAERQRLHDIATSGRPLLLVLPTGERGSDDVPAPVLAAAADAIAQTGPATQVRTAPLTWRDPVSDAALVRLLAAWLGAEDVDYLDPHGDGDGAAIWSATVNALDTRVADAPGGDETPAAHRLDQVDQVDQVDQHALALLRRWRPARDRRGLVLMFTGLSGSGKSTVARGVAERVRDAGRTVTLLDGDVVRTFLSAGLGFDRLSRERNVERIGFVAAEVARHGGVAICAPIAPYRSGRATVRSLATQHGDFVLVHVSTPLEECERRDLKGLYAKARAGLISEFTGISDPYEEPEDADLDLDTSTLTTAQAVRRVVEHLTAGGWLPKGES
jgi:sulfate adenylyltransferase